MGCFGVPPGFWVNFGEHLWPVARIFVLGGGSKNVFWTLSEPKIKNKEKEKIMFKKPIKRLK